MTTSLVGEVRPVPLTRLQEAMLPDRIAADRLALIFAGHPDLDDLAVEKRYDDGRGD